MSYLKWSYIFYVLILGAQLKINGKFRRQISEGNFGETPLEPICFGLRDVGAGLRRNVVVRMQTRGVTANGRIKLLCVLGF